MIERAQREAEEVKAGADEYALSVLRQLEEQLIKNLGTVQNGILALDHGKLAEEVAEE